MNSKKRTMKVFKYIVKKPVIYVMFFFMFVIVLTVMFTKIQVPIYSEYTCENIGDKRQVILKCSGEMSIVDNSAIVYYQDRNLYLYTSEDYVINGDSIEIKDATVEMSGTVYISVVEAEISLGEYIIDGTFNSVG